MKRLGIYGLGALLIAAASVAIVIAVIAVTDKDDKASDTPVSSALGGASKQACDIFTLADAKRLLGDSAKGGASEESSSSDLAISSCTYMRDSGNNAPVSGSVSASLLMRAPKTTVGIDSNQSQFDRLLPSDTQTVGGYGSAAYWDPQYGRLNILKNNIWYTLNFGPATPSSRTLAQTQQLADLLIDKM